MALPPVIAVASGKGGVGKTTVAVNVALALSAQGHRVGLVDADLYGPDVPRMMGLRRRREASSVTLFAPKGSSWSRLEAVTAHGVQLASAAFLLGEDQGLAIQATFAQMLLQRLVNDTVWDDPDYLVVDLPPGMADIQQFVFTVTGRQLFVLVVVTPQVIAHQDARRLIGYLATQERTDIGGVENMSGQICPHCGETTPLFPPAPAGENIWSTIPKLAAVPFSHVAAVDADAGRPVLVTGAVPEQVAAYSHVAEQVSKKLSDAGDGRP